MTTIKNINKGLGLVLWRLTPPSTIFQLYRGDQFVLLVEETGVLGENHRLVASH
jgi:hypothetical protein